MRLGSVIIFTTFIVIFLPSLAPPALAQVTNAVESDNNTADRPSLAATIFKQILDDPTNLELNFNLMQAQIAEGNLEGAEATLERIMIIDPSSTIARILMADIQIQLGKFVSAKRILDDLIEDENSPPQTVARARAFAEEIQNALETTTISGGYSIFAGQTENAFGRSKDDEILVLDLALENTTRDKSDQVYGYRTHLSVAQELDYQTPTTISGGISFSGRETHDKSRSDVETMAMRFSILRADNNRLYLNGSGSYTDVDHQDFNKSFGLSFGGAKPVANIGSLGGVFSATRTVYFPFSGVSNNDGKTSRAYSMRVDLTRPTRFGFIKLGLIGGSNNADSSIHDYRYEKTEISGYAIHHDFSVNAALSRQWIRYDTADTFISSARQKTGINELALKLRYLNTFEIRGIRHIPFVKLSFSNASSNIPNYRRDGAEFILGIEASF